jgi:uncharacterized protein YdhG (YjbR/CyaY superfamily)
MTKKAQTVDEYISAQPQETRERLEELRSFLALADPNAHEELKWGKPAFVNQGILYVYAASQQHVSLHPTPSVLNTLRNELTAFTVSSNTIRFALDQPVPKALVLKIAKLRVYEKTRSGIGWK